MGGLPALRNDIPLQECLREAYLDGPTVSNPKKVFPQNKNLPKILDRVYPCHDVVKVDVFLPGCPPPGELFKSLLWSVIKGEGFKISQEKITYE
jgi:NAD-reducing hydrogenase small subunit